MNTYAKHTPVKKKFVSITDELLYTGQGATIATTAVDSLDYETLPGLYLFEISDGKTALILVNEATAIKTDGDATITITEDNASTVNIFVDTGVLKVQNLLAGDLSYEITKLGIK